MQDIIEYDDGNNKEPAGIDALVRAEIDMQISTAHAYPRSMDRVAKRVMSLVTLSKESAESCVYALPRGGKNIMGPSIRLAEMLYSQWGNCRGGTRITEVNRKERYVEAEGVFHDLETNAMTTKRVRKNIVDRNGKLFNDDMINTTSNAVAAIAFRNAILSGIPRMIWGEAYEVALVTMRGDSKTLAQRHDDVMKGFAAFGLNAEQVYKIAGVEGKRDLDIDKIITLGATFTALKNEEITVEELLASADSATTTSGSITGGTKQQPYNGTAPEPEPEEKPKRKRRTKAEMEAARLEEEEAKRVAQERKQQVNTPPHDQDTGEIKEEPAPEVNREQKPGPEMGSNMDVGDNEVPSANYDTVFNQIIQDMMDGAGQDDIRGVWGDIINKMENESPETYNRLMEEFKAAEEG